MPVLIESSIENFRRMTMKLLANSHHGQIFEFFDVLIFVKKDFFSFFIDQWAIRFLLTIFAWFTLFFPPQAKSPRIFISFASFALLLKIPAIEIFSEIFFPSAVSIFVVVSIFAANVYLSNVREQNNLLKNGNLFLTFNY